jgi:polygalacturonase
MVVRQAGARWAVATFCAGVVVLAASAGAQDTRQVAEPKIPTSCMQLSAQLRAVNFQLSEADERKLDTARIQSALDKCKQGMAVELKPESGSNAFLTGPLEMRAGVTLMIDEGVTLFGSRDATLYDVKRAGAAHGLCGTMTAGAPAANSAGSQTATPGRDGCRPLISVTNVKNAGVMGDGVIDGRGYAKILGKDYSWWEMARRAEAGKDRSLAPRMIVGRQADGLVLYRINLHNATNLNVGISDTNGFTAWGVHLLTPTIKGADASNTDGIALDSSTNITVAHGWIDAGGDNIAIKAGVTHISVLETHLYDGHGLSIGGGLAAGQSFLLVDDLTEDRTTNGIRVGADGAHGGPVHDLVYQNVCMRGVKRPIAIGPYGGAPAAEGAENSQPTVGSAPAYKAISISNVIATTPGDVLIAGPNDEHRTEVTLDGVHIEGIMQPQVQGRFATVKIGSRGSNLDFGGTEVKVIPVKDVPPGTRAEPAFSCTEKFIPME